MGFSARLRAALLDADWPVGYAAVDGPALTAYCDAFAIAMGMTPVTRRQVLTASSGDFVIDPNDGSHITLTLTGSLTSLTMLALDLDSDEGSTIKLEIIQGGAGGYTVGSWVGFGFVSATPPTLVPTAGYANVITAVVSGGIARFMGQRPSAGFPA